MTSARFVISLLLGGCCSIARPASADVPADQPNLVFILADDLGKEWISCYGAEDIETPRIDALAAGGMRFENFYGMPQCTPSRVALLTGQYPWRNGWVNHWDVPRWGVGYFDWRKPRNRTVFRLLQQLGYRTAVAGKWQINDFRVQPDAMTHHGFDEWFMWTGGESGNPPSAQRYADPYIHTKEGSRTYPGAFGPDLYAGFLIDFIRKNKERPFAVYYAMTLPHTPFTATPAEPKAEGSLGRHKAMVRYMDQLVGRVVDALDEEGLREKTIVIYTTDNGSTGGITGHRHGRPVQGAKMSQVEAGACLPFIVNGPGRVPAGVVTEALADMTDLLPTLLELGGGAVPADVPLDGRSMAPLLLGRTNQTPREWILSMGGFPGTTDAQGIRNKEAFGSRVLRDQRHKVWVSTKKKIVRLHDLTSDPQEATNLVDSPAPEHRAALAKFQAVLATLPDRDARPVYTPDVRHPTDVLRPDGRGE